MANDDPRTASVTVLLTANERRHLRKIAKREMLSLSTWMRKLVVAELVRQARDQEASDAKSA